MRDWLYVPATPALALAWGAGMCAFLVLRLLAPNLLGVSTVLGKAPASVLTPVIGLLLLDASILWLHLSPQYLTWRTQASPFVGTLLTLAIVCCLTSGAIALRDGRATLAIPGGAHTFDLQSTGLCVLEGMVGLLGVLTLSWPWRVSDVGLDRVRRACRSSRGLLERACRQRETLPLDEKHQLDQALEILTTSRQLLPVLVRSREVPLLNAWSMAAEAIGKQFRLLSPSDLPDACHGLEYQIAQIRRDA